MKVIISGKVPSMSSDLIANVGDADKQVIGIVFRDDTELANVISHLTEMLNHRTHNPEELYNVPGYLMFPHEWDRVAVNKIMETVKAQEATGGLKAGFKDANHDSLNTDEGDE